MAIITLHFCGTDCWPTEGEVKGPGIDPSFFCEESGYIPVRLYNLLKSQGSSFVIPGPGAPWSEMWSELWIPSSKYISWGTSDTATGYSMIDLAGHATACCVGAPSSGRKRNDGKKVAFPSLSLAKNLKNLLGAEFSTRPTYDGYCWWSEFNLESLYFRLKNSSPNKVTRVNLIGHSRGGVAAIIASNDIHRVFPNAEINVFTIDPVPGSGELDVDMVRLSKGVKNYVGVYAIDERSSGFNGIVPKYYNERGKLVDALKGVDNKSDQVSKPKTFGGGRYRLIYAPGRHGTVAGLRTHDGKDTSSSRKGDAFSYVPSLVYRLATAYFIKWGSSPEINRKLSRTKSAAMQQDIKTNMSLFRRMRDWGYVMKSPSHYNERGVTSSWSDDSSDWEYLEDMIGIELVKRKVWFMHSTRSKVGQVKWEALEDINPKEFV